MVVVVVVLRQTEGAAVGQLQHSHAEALVLVAQAQLDPSAAQGRGLVIGERGGRLLAGPGGTTGEDRAHTGSQAKNAQEIRQKHTGSQAKTHRKSGKTHRKLGKTHRKSGKTHRK